MPDLSISLEATSPLEAYWSGREPASWKTESLCLQEVTGLCAVLVTGSLQAESLSLSDDGSLFLSNKPNRASGQSAWSLWLAPNQWLLTSTQLEGEFTKQLQAALPDDFTITAASSSRCAIDISGEAAEQLLNKGCGLNISSGVFMVGDCAQTVFAQVDILLQKLSEEPSFRVFVGRSEADYLWRWLLRASGEFALVVRTDVTLILRR